MKIYYPTRKVARATAKAINLTATDCGSDKPANRRWAIDFKNSAAAKAKRAAAEA